MKIIKPTFNYFAQPLEENLFEWHFTIRGPDDTPFAKGNTHLKNVLVGLPVKKTFKFPSETKFNKPPVIISI